MAASREKSPSNEEIIADVNRVAKELGHEPSSTEYDKHGKYDQGTVLYRLGGEWPEVLERAGLESNREETRGGVRVTRQEILDDIVRVAEEIGHVPMVDEYNEHGKHSHVTLHKRVGEYRVAIDEAGLDPDDLPSGGRRGRPLTPKDKILDDLAKVGHEVYDELGRRPTITEYNERGEYAAQTASKRFDGDLGAGFDAAGVPGTGIGSTTSADVNEEGDDENSDED